MGQQGWKLPTNYNASYYCSYDRRGAVRCLRPTTRMYTSTLLYNYIYIRIICSKSSRACKLHIGRLHLSSYVSTTSDTQLSVE